MRAGLAWWLLFLFLALPSWAFAAEGMFQGKIVDPPGRKQAASGWIFVQGRNRMVRRVDVTRASIVAAPDVWLGLSKKCSPECLAIGQEVRVTAEQDGSGEWRAKRVEILRAAGDTAPVNRATAKVYQTLLSPHLGCWITTAGRSRIQPLTEKSIITQWSGGIMNDVL
jgi:hypothetical protein